MGPKILAVAVAAAVAMVKAASYGCICSFWLDSGGSIRYLGCRQSWWLWLWSKLMDVVVITRNLQG